MSAVLDSLRELLAQRFDICPERLTADTTLKEAGIDSLAAIDLAVAVEQRFAIELTENDIELESSLGELATVVERQRSSVAAD